MRYEERLDVTFAALADPTRRAILARLAKGDATVMELVEPFELSQPAITKHLNVLERAGLISRSRDGQRRPCRLEAGALRDLDRWVDRFRQLLEARFEALDEVLEDLKRDEKTRRKP
ncbi:MAG TPA: metalloregulator ArsR/SmtB family transcription factor [Kofleriaceae bacterium]|nr:metalloregulator ArsR/SmtB family transcription factor [Kofleriaceae bacterium]